MVLGPNVVCYSVCHIIITVESLIKDTLNKGHTIEITSDKGQNGQKTIVSVILGFHCRCGQEYIMLKQRSVQPRITAGASK